MYVCSYMQKLDIVVDSYIVIIDSMRLSISLILNCQLYMQILLQCSISLLTNIGFTYIFCTYSKTITYCILPTTPLISLFQPIIHIHILASNLKSL